MITIVLTIIIVSSCFMLTLLIDQIFFELTTLFWNVTFLLENTCENKNEHSLVRVVLFHQSARKNTYNTSITKCGGLAAASASVGYYYESYQTLPVYTLYFCWL